MAILDIIEYPDPRLRQCSVAVKTFDHGVRQLAQDLLETMYATSGIGLSAPQAGDFRRVLVMDLSDDHSCPKIFVNPEILQEDIPALVEESCLSVPDVVGNVIRSTRLRVRASDTDGQVFEEDLEDMHAVCLQHEMDHLEGILFVDHLSWFRRWKVKRAAMARAG